LQFQQEENMKLFQNILVYQSADRPVSAALRIAARLSRQMGSRVKVVDVRQANHHWWKDVFEEKSLSPEFERSEQQDSLNALADEVDFESDDAQVQVLEGRPIDVLVNESLAGNHDLILKDTESESENLFFGSLDLRLLRLAPTPVWLADPDVPAKTRRILAAIDPHVSGDEMQMNERIIRLASMLARQDSAELYVVSAWHTPAPGSEQESDDYKRFQSAKSRIRQRAWENVEHVVNTSLLQIPASQVLFENGIPGDTIVSAVLNVQPDLLVMGTVARQGIPGLWIGNTAEEVTRQIECSVLTIKPKDFEFLLPLGSHRR
jgi:nucleotide-binding universal stress UspA family protein